MKKIILAAAMYLALSVLAASRPAQACQLTFVPLAERVQTASEVFAATVDHIVTIKDKTGAEQRGAIVTVEKSFKGKANTQVVVFGSVASQNPGKKDCMDEAVLNEGDHVILLTKFDASGNRRTVSSWLHVHAASDAAKREIVAALRKGARKGSR